MTCCSVLDIYSCNYHHPFICKKVRWIFKLYKTAKSDVSGQKIHQNLFSLPSLCYTLVCCASVTGVNVVLNCCRHDSDTATPPGSPTHPHLKDVFPSKSPSNRRSSRFSISKVKTKQICDTDLLL